MTVFSLIQDHPDPIKAAMRAHKGMLEAAVRISEQLSCRLLKLVEKTNAKELVVTGHSLGAGVASLVALLLVRGFWCFRSREIKTR